MAYKLKRSYKLVTKRGTTAKRFKTLTEAWKYLKADSPDLIPSDLLKQPLRFADGYLFLRADIGAYVPE